MNEKPSGTEKSFIEHLGFIVGAIGGVASLIVVLGYVIVISFLSRFRLYGLVDFSLQFYKEATISFLNDIFVFYTSYYYMIVVALIIVFIPLLARTKYLKSTPMLIYFILVLIVVAFTLNIELFNSGFLGMSKMTAQAVKDFILYSFAFPTQFAVFLYLAHNFTSFEPRKWLKTYYGLFLVSFLILFISIPIKYGSSSYDISIYRIMEIECDNNLKTHIPYNYMNSALFMLGHTDGRLVLFHVYDTTLSPVLIDRGLVKMIKVHSDIDNPFTLRGLFEGGPNNLLPDGVKTENITRKDKKWAKFVK